MRKRTEEEQKSNDYLEKINGILWNTLMIKSHEFNREDGLKIMNVLEEWANDKTV